jgi:hypothetical protein
MEGGVEEGLLSMESARCVCVGAGGEERYEGLFNSSSGAAFGLPLFAQYTHTHTPPQNKVRLTAQYLQTYYKLSVVRCVSSICVCSAYTPV